MPSTISGTTSSGSATAGIVDVEPEPGKTRSLLPAPAPSTSTRPWRDQVGGPGAGQAEQLGDRGVDALAGQRLGDREAAVVAAGRRQRLLRRRRPRPSSRRPVGRSTRVPSSRMPRNAWTRISPAATLMQMSATLKIGQFGSIRKSIDVALERAGLAEASGRSGCRRRPPSSRPSATAQSRLPSRPAEPEHDARTATIATQESTTVYAVPVLNAAPGLRVRCSWSRSPTSGSSGWPVRCSTASALGDLVDGVERPRDAARRGRRTRRRSATEELVGRVARAQRRSSRCLHVMHSVARGNAINRILPIGLPHDSQTP